MIKNKYESFESIINNFNNTFVKNNEIFIKKDNLHNNLIDKKINIFVENQLKVLNNLLLTIKDNKYTLQKQKITSENAELLSQYFYNNFENLLIYIINNFPFNLVLKIKAIDNSFNYVTLIIDILKIGLDIFDILIKIILKIKDCKNITFLNAIHELCLNNNNNLRLEINKNIIKVYFTELTNKKKILFVNLLIRITMINCFNILNSDINESLLEYVNNSYYFIKSILNNNSLNHKFSSEFMHYVSNISKMLNELPAFDIKMYYKNANKDTTIEYKIMLLLIFKAIFDNEKISINYLDTYYKHSISMYFYCFDNVEDTAHITNIINLLIFQNDKSYNLLLLILISILNNTNKTNDYIILSNCIISSIINYSYELININSINKLAKLHTIICIIYLSCNTLIIKEEMYIKSVEDLMSYAKFKSDICYKLLSFFKCIIEYKYITLKHLIYKSSLKNCKEKPNFSCSNKEAKYYFDLIVANLNINQSITYSSIINEFKQIYDFNFNSIIDNYLFVLLNLNFNNLNEMFDFNYLNLLNFENNSEIKIEQSIYNINRLSIKNLDFSNKLINCFKKIIEYTKISLNNNKIVESKCLFNEFLVYKALINFIINESTYKSDNLKTLLIIKNLIIDITNIYKDFKIKDLIHEKKSILEWLVENYRNSINLLIDLNIYEHSIYSFNYDILKDYNFNNYLNLMVDIEEFVQNIFSLKNTLYNQKSINKDKTMPYDSYFKFYIFDGKKIFNYILCLNSHEYFSNNNNINNTSKYISDICTKLLSNSFCLFSIELDYLISIIFKIYIKLHLNINLYYNKSFVKLFKYISNNSEIFKGLCINYYLLCELITIYYINNKITLSLEEIDFNEIFKKNSENGIKSVEESMNKVYNDRTNIYNNYLNLDYKIIKDLIYVFSNFNFVNLLKSIIKFSLNDINNTLTCYFKDSSMLNMNNIQNEFKEMFSILEIEGIPYDYKNKLIIDFMLIYKEYYIKLYNDSIECNEVNLNLVELQDIIMFLNLDLILLNKKIYDIVNLILNIITISDVDYNEILKVTSNNSRLNSVKLNKILFEILFYLVENNSNNIINSNIKVYLITNYMLYFCNNQFSFLYNNELKHVKLNEYNLFKLNIICVVNIYNNKCILISIINNYPYIQSLLDSFRNDIYTLYKYLLPACYYITSNNSNPKVWFKYRIKLETYFLNFFNMLKNKHFSKFIAYINNKTNYSQINTVFYFPSSNIDIPIESLNLFENCNKQKCTDKYESVNNKYFIIKRCFSFYSILIKNNNLKKKAKQVNTTKYKINNSFYILNPSGDLTSSENMFKSKFKCYLKSGYIGSTFINNSYIEQKRNTKNNTFDNACYYPSLNNNFNNNVEDYNNNLKIKEDKEIKLLIPQDSDCYFYIGHNSGKNHVRYFDKNNKYNYIAFILGCESANLDCFYNYNGIALNLLYNYCISNINKLDITSLYIGALWKITDKDLDNYFNYILDNLINDTVPNIISFGLLIQNAKKQIKFKCLNSYALVLYNDIIEDDENNLILTLK